jgi:hypothetical protein
MLYLTQVYLKISAYRKNTLQLKFAAENGIKQGFDQLYGYLLQSKSLAEIDEAEIQHLRSDVLGGGKELVTALCGGELPLSIESDWEQLSWKARTDFSLQSVQDREDYIEALYCGTITSTGRLESFDQEKESILDSSLKIQAGHIPLPMIPGLIDRKMTAEERSSLEAERQIEFYPLEQSDIPASLAFSEGDLLPPEAALQIAKALKIKIFRPQDLSARKLRGVLGLEENDDPVPDGVYLIKDDLGLGGVFIQGDVKEMVLAIQENYQVILFRKDRGLWELKFNPKEGKSIFVTPDGTFFYDLLPLGMVVVNGKINSLGGGIVNAAGEVIICKDEEIPCLLKGVNLTIISSDEITLSSHLIYQGVRWEEGVPYLKDSDSQLLIFSAGKDFFEGSEKEGGIRITNDSPEDLKIQASLTASGRQLSVQGKNKKIQVLGSVHAAGFDLQENTVKIKFDERFLFMDDQLQNAPKTKNPVLYVAHFKTTTWKEDSR